MEREKFSSRMGFILLSAGCAIGLGNVYRFPILTGSYGGALFVIIYIIFLVLLGIPVMVSELSVGRASKLSIAKSFDVLEKKGQKWHLMKYLGIGGNYLLMICYTPIAGLMCIYFAKYFSGSIVGIHGEENLAAEFGATVSNVPEMIIAMAITVVICFLVCSFGLNSGVEKVTKFMMVLLLIVMIGLVAYSMTFENAIEGVKFYFIPSFKNIEDVGLVTVVGAAMGQAFFTLSVGMGSIAIFGSYIDRSRRLLGETIVIVVLDTIVALLAGLIIFPACFTYNSGVTADAGSVSASFLFTTLSNVFNNMDAGRIMGSLFFLLLIFAAFSTIIAVFENIISFWLELTKLSRRVICLINVFLVGILSLPAVFSFNIWGGIFDFQGFEDKLVSNLILPVGAFVYVLFVTHKFGWGWDNFTKEANTGTKGLRVPQWIKPYMKFVLPVIIAVVLVMGWL